MATENSLPDGFTNPANETSGNDVDDYGPSNPQPGEQIEGMFLGIQKQGEGEHAPWYLVRVKQDDGLRQFFAPGDMKGSITRGKIDPGDEVLLEMADERTESEEYGTFLPVKRFGVK